MITSLKPNQVFIFGSNSSGFHGAGAAGLACRGDSRNTWRQDAWFCKALEAPLGSPDRIGKWAVVGQARGLQTGREGKSYGIITITRPGMKRSTPLANITDEIFTLFSFAERNTQYEFLWTDIGAGLAGYSNDEMFKTFDVAVCDFGWLPKNIIIGELLYGKKWQTYYETQ